MRAELGGSGHRLWRDHFGAVEVRFVGRGPGDRTAAAAVAGAPSRIAWSKQVHSSRVLRATVGPCGEGDALTTRHANLALSVVTADCVPLLLAGDGEIASVHAGWRGIAAGVVDRTLDRLETSPGGLVAWLGPAIGPCCYEVGDEVAAQVAAASDSKSEPLVVVPGPGTRPHLDLHAAVRCQLRRAGIETAHAVADCTRCSGRSLHSYRREGPGAGRNFAFIWMHP